MRWIFFSRYSMRSCSAWWSAAGFGLKSDSPVLEELLLPAVPYRRRAAPARHTASRPPPLPINAASEWRLSLLQCSASVAFSCVLSVILTGERSLHFQLRRDRLTSLSRAPKLDGSPINDEWTERSVPIGSPRSRQQAFSSSSVRSRCEEPAPDPSGRSQSREAAGGPIMKDGLRLGIAKRTNQSNSAQRGTSSCFEDRPTFLRSRHPENVRLPVS